jgi:glutathione synthase/RimK-type ligase-like ATP-grasp enzyme
LGNIHIVAWDKMLEMASHCYEATGLGYMGVDLVVDVDEGPALIETA